MEDITLTWECINSEKEAIETFKNLDKDEKTVNEEFKKADGFENTFKTSFASFKESKDLTWSTDQPLIIKWSFRVSLEKNITDIIIDKDISVNDNYEEYMKEQDHFDYTIFDEIVNSIKNLIVNVYEQKTANNFNNLFETFYDDGETFGFDLYQLNAVNTDDGQTFIIDVKWAEDNKIFESIACDVTKRIRLKRR